MFCRKCGAELDAQSDFCSNCGAKVSLDPSAGNEEKQKNPSTTEAAIWMLQVQRKYSMLKIVTCYMVFFKDEMVLAHLSGALRKAESQKASDQIKEKGLGFLKGSAEMMKYWSKFSQRYYTMDVDEILAEDPTNMVIPYEDISKVLFKGSSESFFAGDDSSSSTVDGKLELSLNRGETIKFTHTYSSGREIKDTLTDFFGEKLKYKK
ncbi:MAG: zinc ribbon domain-containing protein [Clostridium sp.]|nr:zinc ribbon domain-containing protein [Clostridium sp.]